MKIAVTATGPSLEDQVEPRFGRTPYYLFINTETMEFEALRNASSGGGVGIQSAQLMSDKNVQYVLTGNCGPNAAQVFEAAGIHVIVGISGTIRKAVEEFKAGAFAPSKDANVASHFGMGGGSGAEPEGMYTGGAMGAGQGRGMGGGRGMGMGGGGGRGMGMGGGGGRGMGMGGGRGMGIGANQPRVPDTFHATTANYNDVSALKEQAEMLEKQLQEIKSRIDRVQTGGGGAVAYVNTAECNGCGVCVKVCPVDAITMNDTAFIDQKKCTGCGICVDNCPQNAIFMK
jgi:predicted Fe-Mo cluster-binding NifX family protein/ferredoxin